MNSSNPDAWVGIVFIMVILASCCVALIVIAGWVLVHYLLYNVAMGVPPEHRKQEPWLTWLLLIPFFNLFWNFVVFASISDGYKSYFDARGVADVADCGKGIGLAYSVVSLILFILGMGAAVFAPLGCLPLLPLVLLVIYLLQTNTLKKRIEADTQSQMPVEVI